MPDQSMHLSRETVFVPALFLHTTREQSVELDYLLPDYYPDFFRLLHCTAAPTVLSHSVSGGTVRYALRVRLHVLYCGESTSAVQSLTQQLEYTGECPLPAACADLSPQIQICAEPAYLNCRAVDPRRIDLRGAVKIHIRICGEQPKEVLRAAEGAHLQSRPADVQYASQLLRSEKQFTMSEDIRIAETQPALLSVLREDALLTVHETRVLAGKLVIKGEAAVTLLYAAGQGMETLTAVFPFSQIAEQDGLSEEMVCSAAPVLRELLITTESEGGGDIRLIHADLQIVLQCLCVQVTTAPLLCDLYSTVHPLLQERETLPLLTAPAPVRETRCLKQTLRKAGAALTQVYAAWAVPGVPELTAGEDGAALLSGNVQCRALVLDAENRLQLLEEALPYTWALPGCPAEVLLPLPAVKSCPYTLTGSDSVTMEPELMLCGSIMQQSPQTLLTGAVLRTEERLGDTGDYALRLYFGQQDESLWEIAKRCHTSAAAIREENEVAGDCLPAAQMLLIPTVK